MSDSLDVSGWISSARQFKPVTIIDIIAQLNSLRAETLHLIAERDEARRIARQMKAERDAKSQAIEELNGVIHYWMTRTYELAAERDKALLQMVKITYKTPKGEVEEINPVRVEIGKELPGSVTHKPFTYTTPTD